MESIEEEFVYSRYGQGYSADTDTIREHEYPLLNGTTYLDHAGTTLYAKSFIESFSDDMISSLFGNPYSMSVSSRLSTERTDDFFNASPDEFDVVFVANATAAIKFIRESFRDDPRGFWYRYHVDAHTSVVGVRELADIGYQCFDDTDWCGQIRSAANEGRNIFTLLNAASFLSTTPLNLSDTATAPDFTALSFYKIFGFPDLGALVVRKSTVSALKRRKFFGGGTVDMRLEDGTLLFHSIIALNAALKTHKRLYGLITNISSYTRFLAQRVYNRLSILRHFNSIKVYEIYQSSYRNLTLQGPIIAFNMRNSHGEWIPKSEEGEELRRHYATGLRCGDNHDMLGGRPTGILRVSLGAMSNLKDIDSLTEVVEEFYIEKVPPLVSLSPPMDTNNTIAP
ncbi:hypothetical protein N7444_006841 [Penicillium canescens]|nr:hypothetical protein N7444_006841 [Penicillium canescens]